MISRSELQRLANREKVALGTLEKDYVLTEILKALSWVTSLSDVIGIQRRDSTTQNIFC